MKKTVTTAALMLFSVSGWTQTGLYSCMPFFEARKLLLSQGWEPNLVSHRGEAYGKGAELNKKYHVKEVQSCTERGTCVLNYKKGGRCLNLVTGSETVEGMAVGMWTYECPRSEDVDWSQFDPNRHFENQDWQAYEEGRKSEASFKALVKAYLNRPGKITYPVKMKSKTRFYDCMPSHDARKLLLKKGWKPLNVHAKDKNHRYSFPEKVVREIYQTPELEECWPLPNSCTFMYKKGKKCMRMYAGGNEYDDFTTAVPEEVACP